MYIKRMVPMVLNPHGIEPIFLKLNSWSPGVYDKLQCIKLEKERMNFRRKKNYKHLTQFLKKNSFTPVLGLIPRHCVVCIMYIDVKKILIYFRLTQIFFWQKFIIKSFTLLYTLLQ